MRKLVASICTISCRRARAGCIFVDADASLLQLSNGTANVVDSVISNSGNTINSPSGGIDVQRAGLVRAEGVTFAYNGRPPVGDEPDNRYGVRVAGVETRLYTDDPVFVDADSRGQKLTLFEAPDGPFLTGPPE